MKKMQKFAIFASSMFTVVGFIFTFAALKAVIGSPELPEELKQK